MPRKKKLPPGVRERDGKYYYRFSIKNPVTGKRKQKEIGGYDTPKEAEQEGIQTKASLLQGTYHEQDYATVSDWCDTWVKWYASTGQVKEITVDQRKAMIKLIKSHIGGLYLHEVTEDTYQNSLHDLSVKHSNRTVSSYHSCARMIFKRAKQRGKIQTDPTQHAFVPKKNLTFEEREALKRLPRFLEKEELQKFFAAEKNPQVRRVFELLTYTGMRVGELCSLLVSDYNDGQLTISKTRYVPGSVKEYRLTSPKNSSSDRIIQLSKRAIAIIEQQLKWRKAFVFSKGKEVYKDRAFLFVCEKSRAGYPLIYSLVLDHMKTALDRVGLPDSLSPHSLRHTYTSLMAEAGADLDTIQAQLGHKKGSDITRAIYLHVTKAREKRDVNRLDALLDGMS